MSEHNHTTSVPQGTSPQFDILIAGAGFAGSLTALLLHQRGFSVCLVEKGQHPRFAIGESSTPVADLLIRDLSVRYQLPWLYPFSRYGSWQEAHPEITCGIKRGFSYFKHYPHQPFATDEAHSQELLVAASSSDLLSDTNWLRADFDAYLAKQVQEAGITYLDRTDITMGQRDREWTFRLSPNFPEDRERLSPNSSEDSGQLFRQSTNPDSLKTRQVRARFFIDATGGGTLLNTILGIGSSADGFDTDSYAIFSHFDDLPRWTDLLKQAGIPTSDFPYDPDYSALHHVLDQGWIWVLRFNDRRTSLGFALDSRKQPPGQGQPQQQWDDLLHQYPDIGRLLSEVPLSQQPGRIIRSGRLQRKTTHCAGPGWAALPHTAGFVDPLFSSGIAHSLMGVRQLTGILEQHWDREESLQLHLKEYEYRVFQELQLIDRLVAGCYRTMPCFPLFQAWSMVYFAAVITCERELQQGGTAGGYLGAVNPAIRKMVGECWTALLQVCGGPAGQNGNPQPSATAIRRFTDYVQEKIAPFNTAGLMDPACRNMYRHTAAAL